MNILINPYVFNNTSGSLPVTKQYTSGSIYCVFSGIKNNDQANGVAQFSPSNLSFFTRSYQVINSAIPNSSYDAKTGTGQIYNRIKCVGTSITGFKDVAGNSTTLTMSTGTSAPLYGYDGGPYNPGVIGYVYQYLFRRQTCPITMSGIQNGLYDIYIYSLVNYNNPYDPQCSNFTIYSGSVSSSKSTSSPPSSLGNGLLPNFVENETYVKFSNFRVTNNKINILWTAPDNIRGISIQYAPLNAIQLAAIDETFTSSVATPTATPSGSTYSTTQSIVLSSTTSGSTIRYTLDGTVPTNYYGNIYTSSISIFNNTTLKAMAYKLGSLDSDVNTQIYIFPGSGNLNQVTLSLDGTFTNQNTGSLYNIIDGNTSSYWNPPVFNPPNLWTGFTNGIIKYTHNGLVTPLSYSYDITLTNNRSLSLTFDHSDEGTNWTTFDSLNLNFSPTWTPRFEPKSWNGIASSADGSKLVAGTINDKLYTSTDSGVTWTPRESNHVWYSVASSADGSKLVASADNNGQLYTSTDSGTTWTASITTGIGSYVASSADGNKLVATGGQIYTSTDSGVTWTARVSTTGYWSSVASSADGSKLVATRQYGQIYTSTDSGATWTARESTRNWTSVASSTDGSKLVAAAFNGQIYTSTDSGVTWTPRESNRTWSSVASSADGSKLVAVVNGGQIYTSTNSGATWFAQESVRQWRAVTSSADGIKLVAVEYGGGRIYITAEGGGTSTGRKSGTYVLGSSINKKYFRIKMVASDNFPGPYTFYVNESKFI